MPKTIVQGFEQFLLKLEPTQNEHLKSVSHKSSVLKCLESNWAKTRLFETGSFSNGTGVRHYSDTDYFAICPEVAFHNNSGTTLNAIRKTLQATFTQTLIEVKTPSVRISFGVHASEIIEITPAYFHQLFETAAGKRHSYFIPDYDRGWMVSCPAAHKAYVAKQDKRLNGKLKPLIRLIKAWKFYNSIPITSFYLELRAAKYAESRQTIVYDIDLRNILKLLFDNQLARLQDPMGFSGYVLPCKTLAKKKAALSKLATAYGRAENACQCRIARPDLAFEWWQKLFAYKFPAH